MKQNETINILLTDEDLNDLAGSEIIVTANILVSIAMAGDESTHRLYLNNHNYDVVINVPDGLLSIDGFYNILSNSGLEEQVVVTGDTNADHQDAGT